MSAPHASQIINGYLARLGHETQGLPDEARRDLLASIEEHIDEARALLTNETDADLLTMLDRVGDPAELANDEWERIDLPAPEPVRVGLLEVGALILTPLFWPIGVVLLWASGSWNWRDKLIGTLLPPGGYFFLFIVLGAARVRSCGSGRTFRNGHLITYSTCSAAQPGWHQVIAIVLLLLLLVLPILTGIYLAIRLRRRPAGRRLMPAPQG